MTLSRGPGANVKRALSARLAPVAVGEALSADQGMSWRCKNVMASAVDLARTSAS
jgi:hypothetical protein